MATQERAIQARTGVAERASTPGAKGTTTTLPPLENGDRLTRTEFERRYEAMPHLKKAELIEGVVYVGSPVRTDYHGSPNLTLDGWIFLYVAATPGTTGAGNSTVRIDFDNTVQPDA